MKSICIKNNNPDIIAYLSEKIETLELDSLYISKHHFKLYDNIIIHYCSNNLEYFLNKISSIIADTIIYFYETKLLIRLLEYNYFYFSGPERNQILSISRDFLDNDNISKEDNYFCIYDSVLEYLEENNSLILDGFVNFRIQNYMKNLEYVVDIGVNKYLIDKEYNEFIDILKLYISFTPAKSSTIHLIYNNGESVLLDEDKNIIPVNKDAFKYLSDISFSSNDYTLNTLLSLMPKKLIIHLLDNNSDEFINTLKLIFENRIEISSNFIASLN